MINRYVVFAGECYYPLGGWRDFLSSHATAEEAEAVARATGDASGPDWAQVADVEEGRVLLQLTWTSEHRGGLWFPVMFEERP